MNLSFSKVVRLCIVLLLIGFALQLYNEYLQKKLDQEVVRENTVIDIPNNQVIDTGTGVVEDELQELGTGTLGTGVEEVEENLDDVQTYMPPVLQEVGESDYSASQEKEFERLQGIYGEELISILISISEENVFLLQKKGEDCVTELNQYLGREITQCATYKYSILNETITNEEQLGESRKSFWYAGGGIYLFDSINNRLITRLTAMPYRATLPISEVKLDRLDEQTPVITPASLNLLPSGNSEDRGGAELYYDYIQNILTIVPRVESLQGEPFIGFVKVLDTELSVEQISRGDYQAEKE